MKKKKERLVSSILFAIGSIIWIVNVFMNYQERGIIDRSLVIQMFCALCFCAAAVIHFIQYNKQNNRNQDDDCD